MIRRLIKEQHAGLNKQGFRKCNTHSPSTAHILCFLLNSLRIETQAAQDGTRAAFERGRVKLVKAFIQILQNEGLRAFFRENIIGLSFYSGHLRLCGVDDIFQGSLLRRLGLLRKEMDVDIIRDGDLSLREDSKKSTFPASIGADEAVASANREFDEGILDEDLVMKIETECANFDIAGAVDGLEVAGGSGAVVSGGVAELAADGAGGRLGDGGGDVVEGLAAAGVLRLGLAPARGGLLQAGLLAGLLGCQKLLGLVLRRHGGAVRNAAEAGAGAVKRGLVAARRRGTVSADVCLELAT